MVVTNILISTENQRSKSVYWGIPENIYSSHTHSDLRNLLLIATVIINMILCIIIIICISGKRAYESMAFLQKRPSNWEIPESLFVTSTQRFTESTRYCHRYYQYDIVYDHNHMYI